MHSVSSSVLLKGVRLVGFIAFVTVEVGISSLTALKSHYQRNECIMQALP